MMLLVILNYFKEDKSYRIHQDYVGNNKFSGVMHQHQDSDHFEELKN